MGILQQNNPFKFFIIRILAKFRNQEKKEKKRNAERRYHSTRWSANTLANRVSPKVTLSLSLLSHIIIPSLTEVPK